VGVLGPAVAVTEGWIVISYSPWAVRENLATLSRPQRQSSPKESPQ
jgi:hypothetical protein